MNMNDREILARTLQAEAGNQGLGGMIAAGSVIMNRVGSGGYGSGVRDVILAPGQFSAWNSVTGYAGGEQGQDMGFTPSAEAYKAADALLSGQYEDITGGATHYYNPDISQPSWGMGAGGDWKRIGQHVFGKADAGKTGKTGAATMDRPTAQQMQQMQQQPQRRGLMGFLSDPRRREALLSMDRSGLFEGMRQRASADVTRQQEQEALAKEEAKAQQQRAAQMQQQQQVTNRTLQVLGQRAEGGDQFAAQVLAAIQSGAMDPKSGMKMYLERSTSELGGPSVGARKIFANGTIVQSTNQGQRVFDPNGNLVTGEKAAQVVDQANKYEAEQAQRVAGSKKIGTVTADQAVKAFEKSANVTTSIETIDRAISAIDDDAMSGFVANYLPNITKASAELQSAMNQMGLDVISSVTFGALSESEMNVAMETAVPRNLAGPQLREWLLEKRQAQLKARQALERAASYLSVPGNTIASWLELKRGERQETSVNPYKNMTLQQLNDIFSRRSELTQSQLNDLIAALKSKKG